MKKYLAGVAFVLAFAGVAQADQTITAELTYDEALLTSEAGAQSVLNSLHTQSIAECRSLSLISVGFVRDEACELAMVRAAVDKIDVTELASVYQASEMFIDAPETTGVVLAQN